MKKIFYFVLLLLVASLMTRFVSFENPLQAGPPPPQNCVQTTQQLAEKPGDYPCQTIATIKNSYEAEIKPIIEQKCLDCHGIAPRLPIYAKIPLVSRLLRHDMKAAKEDINMTWGFPFVDKKGIKHSLKEIIEVVEAGEMPPWYYKIMHWQAGLNDEETTAILNWAKQSQKLLKK